MKIHTTKTCGVETNAGNIRQSSLPSLSDDAFYLIALAVLLKETVEPGKLKDYLVQGKFVGLDRRSDN
jgi:hypothetical protein